MEMTGKNVARKSKGHPAADDIEVGVNLRRIRESFGITQEALAQALDISFQQVQKYERGLNRMSIGRLLQAARFFRVDPIQFLPPEFHGVIRRDLHEMRDELTRLEKALGVGKARARRKNVN